MIKKLLLLALPVFSFTSFSVLHAQDFGWAANMGGTDSEYGRSVATDDSGYVYTTGFFEGTANFDPGAGTANLTSAGGTDAFIMKSDASGDLIWVRKVGGPGNEYAYAIDVDTLGNIYIAGRYEGTADMDPGTGTSSLTSTGGADMFVLKLNASGDFIWAAGMGGTATDQINSIAVDAVGNVFASGIFNDTADFDPGPGTLSLASEGQQDFFVLKLTASGNLDWAHSFGSTGDDRSYSLAIDDAGNTYATGVFSNTVDFDPGTSITNLTAAGFFDAYVLKLNSAGNFAWAKSMGGTSYDFGYGITADDFGNVYTTGYFMGSADFDPGSGSDTMVSQGHHDIFIHKMDAAGNYKWARSMGGSTDDRGYSIDTDAAGDVYITGYFLSTVDFDHSSGTHTLTPAGKADFYVHKTDSAGNFVWVGQMGGAEHDFGLGLTLDRLGNIYTTGNFEGTADFDPTSNTFSLTPAGASDVFLMKLEQCILIDTAVTLAGSVLTANQSGAIYRWLDCDNNHQPVSGETGRSFTPSISGNYALEITDAGCVDTSGCYFVSPIGIRETPHDLPVTIYPNPATTHLNIDFDRSQQNVQVELFSINGGNVFSQERREGKNLQIDLQSLSAGIYFLKMKTEEGVSLKKIVKE